MSRGKPGNLGTYYFLQIEMISIVICQEYLEQAMNQREKLEHEVFLKQIPALAR